MNDILQFLMDNMANTTVSYYLRKALGKIHERLPTLMNGNTEINEIKEFISKNCLEDDIMKLESEIKNKTKYINTSNVVNMTGGVNKGIVANKVEVEEKISKITIAPPVGSIASDLICINYTKYLIDRYHKFKKADTEKNDMKYTIFYNTIKRKFGATWRMVPLKKFDDLAIYIQDRIDKTKLGKNLKSKNKKRYSSFEEYKSKHDC